MQKARRVATTAAAICERLRAAAAGRWLEVVQEANKDIAQLLADPAAHREPRQTRSAVDPLDQRTLDAAAQKASHGSRA